MSVKVTSCLEFRLTVREVVMHPINEFGSDAQKEKYLPQLGKWSSRGPMFYMLTFP